LAIFRVPNILVVGYINFKSQKLYMSLIRKIRYQLAWDTTNILVVGYINFESQKLSLRAKRSNRILHFEIASLRSQ